LDLAPCFVLKKEPGMQLISIITPVLNEEDMITPFLDHLVGLSGSFELIVVDGGSTDSTCAVVRDYTSRFPARLHLLWTAGFLRIPLRLLPGRVVNRVSVVEHLPTRSANPVSSMQSLAFLSGLVQNTPGHFSGIPAYLCNAIFFLRQENFQSSRGAKTWNSAAQSESSGR
jgi:glycosyltransferase involved in cell wall biosynthesis